MKTNLWSFTWIGSNPRIKLSTHVATVRGGRYQPPQLSFNRRRNDRSIRWYTDVYGIMYCILAGRGDMVHSKWSAKKPPSFFHRRRSSDAWKRWTNDVPFKGQWCTSACGIARTARIPRCKGTNNMCLGPFKIEVLLANFFPTHFEKKIGLTVTWPYSPRFMDKSYQGWKWKGWGLFCEWYVAPLRWPTASVRSQLLGRVIERGSWSVNVYIAMRNIDVCNDICNDLLIGLYCFVMFCTYDGIVRRGLDIV